MRTIKLTLSYDGTAYHGWQVQPNGPTVQQVLEDAIGRILGPHRTTAAGRTDAGVHALGQVAALRTGKPMPVSDLQWALNAVLPRDVAVVAAEEVPNEFDPRRDATSKLYRYRVWNQPVRPVHVRDQVWHHYGVDWDRVEAALPALLGKHDFSSFEDSGSSARHAVRTLSRVALVRDPPAEHETWIEVEGDGFLKQMVRNIVGTLVEIGRAGPGREPLAWMSEVIAARNRRAAGPTAPASGLCLVRVDYT